MGLLQIMSRGDEKAQRFEDALYDIEEAIGEACEIYDEMKEQFSQRGETDGAEYSARMRRRMNNRGGSMSQRRGRDSRGRYM